jgi:hypothetical protein
MFSLMILLTSLIFGSPAAAKEKTFQTTYQNKQSNGLKGVTGRILAEPPITYMALGAQNCQQS